VVVETLDDIRAGFRKVIQFMVPSKGLSRIKRQMRRKIRKPADMPVRTFFNHIARINYEELPKLPPNYNRAQSLSQDEIIDILLFAFPQSWQSEMNRQGFDPQEHTPMELIDFCERIEAAEEMETDKNTKRVGSKSDANKQVAKKSKTNSSGGPNYYCEIHGKNYSHNTKDCRQKNSGSSGNNNKNWANKSNANKHQASKELAAFIKKQVKAKVAAELHAMDGKRKASDDGNKSDEDVSEGEINAIEQMDLAQFDYGDMENLRIQSEKEESEKDSDNDSDSDIST
jgi:hypothetical protein